MRNCLVRWRIAILDAAVAAGAPPPESSFAAIRSALRDALLVGPELAHGPVDERVVDHLRDVHAARDQFLALEELEVVLEAGLVHTSVGVAALRVDRAEDACVLDRC